MIGGVHYVKSSTFSNRHAKDCKEATSCKASFEKAVEYINEISQYFRKKKHPVVIIQDVEAGGQRLRALNVWKN